MIEEQLKQRCENKCELCQSTENFCIYTIAPATNATLENSLLICKTCEQKITQSTNHSSDYWQCLKDTMWSQEPPVQVIIWRLLTQQKQQAWAQNLLEVLYLDEATLQWAQQKTSAEKTAQHKDSNGTALANGDTITLIKDLNVKGANFTAKRGTAVKNISLVENNPKHIEGKIKGQQIVILTQFVKRSH